MAASGAAPDAASARRRARRRAAARRRVLAVVPWTVAGLLILAGVYYIVDFPRERELRRRNRALGEQVDMLNRRLDEAVAVMEDIAARDNNFYRVMMQADPLTPAYRYAGIERQRAFDRLDSMPDAELVRTVTGKLDRLDRMLYTQSKSFDYLSSQARGLSERLDHTPAIQPISEKYLKQMASGYGYRRDPIYGTTKFHEGMDFSSPVGTPVYATASGTVSFGGWKSGYGNLVEVNHGNNYETRYAHLSEVLVKPGATVSRGDLIGKVGNTGKSTGPHLHYEVRFRGQPQNPVNYYYFDLTPEEYDLMVRQADNAGHVMD